MHLYLLNRDAIPIRKETMRLTYLSSIFGLWLLLGFSAFSQEQAETKSSSNGPSELDDGSVQSTEGSALTGVTEDSSDSLADIDIVENPSDALPQPTGDNSGVTLTEAQQANLRVDCGVLQTIFTTMNGANWVKKDDWGSVNTLNCCNWYGISCNNGGRVKGIRLSANGISGPIPPEIGLLSGLLTLDLSRNQISGQLPDSLRMLTALLSLNLDGNNLGGAIGDSLGGMINLQNLHLRNNSFTSVPESLSRLIALRGLFLSNNQLSGVIPSGIFKMTNVEILALDYNQLTGNIPDDIGNMVKLNHLYLKHNMLDGSLPEGLSRCTELRTM
ncbi:hypothetical protein K7432_012577 [Basidiobolus ranarum]|uniref:Leucine-rich repeat-containing N-terminal plant-type domain-containing protein n=1 Tax=Basidiobolus ranarum TaxID=34480 RepID=A0ABR2WKI7_9FUNG